MSDFLGFPDDASIVVTGAGSGIGRATALLAASVGLRVGAWDLAEDAARSCAAEIEAAGGTGFAVGLDCADRGQVEAAWDSTVEAIGGPAYLAAVAGPPSFLGDEIGFGEAVSTAVDCMRVPTEAWIEKVPLAERAAVYVSSVQGPRYGAGVPWYTVAKSGIDGYMRSLAAMRPGGVRANAVLPDWTLTPRTEKFVETVGGPEWPANPMGRIGRAEDIANAIVFLLSPAASYVNGVSLEIEGGARLRSLGWMRMAEASGSA
jgi:NAD(P)-dependent dehydrogenase (short-subunit alcohol dehydrogenase family)